MSVPQQRPLCLDDLKTEILDNQNENHCKTEASIDGVTSDLAQISDGLNNLKRKLLES